MRISEVKEFVRSMAKQDSDHRCPILVEGHMGIGKSQSIQQVAKELGYQYEDLRLATQDPGDLVGLPRIIDGKTCWARPSWLPSDKNVKFMLVLEELNRAPVDVQQAIFQVLTEKRIHTHELPTDTIMVACINPSDTIYNVSEFDPALNTRFFRCELECDVDEWLTWAKQSNVDDRVVSFIGVHKELLCNPTEKGACPIPRTWVTLSNLIKTIPENLFFSACIGSVGNEAGLVFQKFCNSEYKKPVMGKEILNNYAKIKSKLVKQQEDELFATATDLIAEIKSNPKLSKEQLANLIEYLLDSHSEMKVKVILEVAEQLGDKLDDERLLADIDKIMKAKSAKEAKKKV